jgi:hypothetical protein
VAYSVESNGKRTPWHGPGRFASIVDDRLVVLGGTCQQGLDRVEQVKAILTSYDPWEKFMRTTLRPAGWVSADTLAKPNAPDNQYLFGAWRSSQPSWSLDLEHDSS